MSMSAEKQQPLGTAGGQCRGQRGCSACSEALIAGHSACCSRALSSHWVSSFSFSQSWTRTSIENSTSFFCRSHSLLKSETVRNRQGLSLFTHVQFGFAGLGLFLRALLFLAHLLSLPAFSLTASPGVLVGQ